MPTKLLHVLSFLGKAAGLALTIAGPLSGIRERDRLITGRNRRDFAPVLKRYERVCFTKEAVRPLDRPGVAFAQLLHPGHPLLLSMSDLILEQNGNLLRQGALLVDPADEGTEPHLLFLLTHEITSGDGQVLSKRLQFVRVSPDGSATFAGWAPHLDLEPLAPADRPLLTAILDAPWICADQEKRALGLAAGDLVPQHYEEVASRRIAHVDKTLAAVHERLTQEIAFWSDRWLKLKEDQDAGKDVRLNLENTRRTVSDLEGRLENRRKELQSMRHIVNGTPVALGGALVIPVGLLNRLRGEPSLDPVAEKFDLSHDIMRHTFISMHVAKYRSMGEAALQAGNSESIIRKHYLDLKTPAQDEQFFGILPTPVVAAHVAHIAPTASTNLAADPLQPCIDLPIAA
jgi:hypothetical protein